MLPRAMGAMAALLRLCVPADRRLWVEAVCGEAAEVPSGWPRLRWLAGGLRVTAREAALARRLRWPLAFAAAIGVVAYALGPLGFPLRFAGPWPASLYDAALGLGVYLALSAPVAAGLRAARRGSRPAPAAAPPRQGALAGLCTGAAAALVVAALSTATIALLPYDTWLRQWAGSHIGHWTPVAGTWGPILGPGTRAGYVAGASAFASGYLIVLVLGPLLGCGLGAWGARCWRVLAR